MDLVKPLSQESRPAWLDQPLSRYIALNAETIAWAAIFLLAVFSRFYLLEPRVMSHDENSHVYYSWRFYKGQGFAHDPLMHGPFQFHIVALTYFMFGDNDFTARIPAVLFSIATVVFLWAYRRYLGKTGAILGGMMMLISPYMLYYGRYVRNEAFVAFFGVAMIWALLRYLETGQAKYAYWLSAVTALHFTSKETSFIYQAQALIFLAVYLLYRLTKTPWRDQGMRTRFILAVIAVLVLVGAAGGYSLLNREAAALNPDITQAPVAPGEELTPPPAPTLPPLILAAGILAGLALLAAIFFVVRGYTWKRLRAEPSFGAAILLGTMVLPQLAAFPITWFGTHIPTNANQVMAMTTNDMLRIALFVIPLSIAAVVIGLLWDRREWIINAAIFYGIFVFFYTSVFTNGAGFLTGLVGSLGYWLEQQGVMRGNQPLYYYALVQMPVYEYLPMLGTWLAAAIALVGALRRWLEGEHSPRLEMDEPVNAADEVTPVEGRLVEDEALASEQTLEPAPAFPLFFFWAVTSLIAFSIAGEKMPWLTVHVTLGAILSAAWGLARVVEAVDWQSFRKPRQWLLLVLLPAFLSSALAAFGSLLGANPPFQGQSLQQLQDTSTFLTSLIFAAACAAGLFYILRGWSGRQFLALLSLGFFGLLAILTARTAITSSYIAYDNANELLVYAHSAPGVKTALAQIEEISRRTTDGLAISVAYDNETSYPYWWYLRNYPNARYFGADVSRTLRDTPLILVGDANFGKIESVVAGQYDRFDYIRLWWPNQDYFNLTWERVRNAFTDRQMRQALWEIWLNRDYTKYGQVTGKDMSLPNWSPAARMRLYVRKDITAKLWNYGAAPVAEQAPVDPFEGKQANLTAINSIGSAGTQPGQFQRPRDLAIAPDGSLYIADTDNHRIQHLAPDGSLLHAWGTYGDVSTLAPGGTFNQPWGLALGPDGSVYVADTWNHRIQKFTADGKFLQLWGYFGQAETPEAFWGPRDVAVGADGRVYVTDTGNKRIVVFDQDGAYITQFGSAGMGPGQFDEPVGLAIDQDGLLYVADTWNQRIQAFQASQDGVNYLPVRSWELQAWYGQSLDNKPYLAVDRRGFVFAVDPEGYRVLQFTLDGQAVRFWGDFGVGLNAFGLPASVAVAPDGTLWVVDAGNNRVMQFKLPGD